MIDAQGNLRCDNCKKKLALKLEGELEIYCPRCKHFNRFNSQYKSHSVVVIEKQTVTKS